MPSTTKLSQEQIASLTKKLKSKIIVPPTEQPKNDKQKNKNQTEQKTQKLNHSIHSDSEMQAIQLFEQMQVRNSGVLQNGMEEQHIVAPTQPKSILKNSVQNYRQQQSDKQPVAQQQSNKEQRSVIIRQQNNIIYALSADRKWNDHIQNQRKGKFQPEQQRALSDAVGQFLAANQITLDQFTRLISEGNRQQNVLRRQKFYKLLSSVLPNRSAHSCYRFIVRNFNNFNRQGPWSNEQIEKLLALVQKNGRKWKLIAKQLNRTSDNVYDKYRALGQQSMEDRIKSLWKLRQVITLLTQIQRQSSIEFLDHNIKKQLQKQNEHDQLDIEQLKSHKYNTKTFVFHHIQIIRRYLDIKKLQSVQLQTLRWKKIVKLIPTKNIFDCRNKMVQILQILFRNQDSLDIELMAFLNHKKVTEESKIEWKQWQSQDYTIDQARNRFMILKKLVQGRSYKPFKNIIAEIQLKIQKRQKQNKP